LSIVVTAAEMEVFAFKIMNDTPLLFIGFMLLSLSSFMTHVLSVFISITSYKKFKRMLEKINVLDSMFSQKIDVRKKQFYALIAQLVFGFVSLGSYSIFSYFYTSDGKEKISHLAIKLICVLGDYIVVLQYINLVLFAGQYFSHINAQLIQLEHLYSQKQSTGHVEAATGFLSHVDTTSQTAVTRELRGQVLCIVDLYEKLLSATRSINTAYSLQILFNIAKIFVHITFCLYLVFVVTLSKDYDKQYWLHALFFCSWAIFQLVLIVFCCDNTKMKVNMNTFK
jgi:hypothetical protein